MNCVIALESEEGLPSSTVMSMNFLLFLLLAGYIDSKYFLDVNYLDLCQLTLLEVSECPITKVL